MSNNFIKLTNFDSKVIYLNVSFIQTILVNDGKTVVNMLFTGDNGITTYIVKQTPEEIFEMIENSGTFNITLK